MIVQEQRSTQPTEFGRQVLDKAGLTNPLNTEAVGIALANASAIVDNAVSQTQEIETLWVDYIEKVMFNQLTPEEAGQMMYEDVCYVIEELKP